MPCHHSKPKTTSPSHFFKAKLKTSFWSFSTIQTWFLHVNIVQHHISCWSFLTIHQHQFSAKSWLKLIVLFLWSFLTIHQHQLSVKFWLKLIVIFLWNKVQYYSKPQLKPLMLLKPWPQLRKIVNHKFLVQFDENQCQKRIKIWNQRHRQIDNQSQKRT